MDYPYELLDPETFQQFCQALLTREFKNVQCFPVAQPDGGRDAISVFHGELGREFYVFQVKFRRHADDGLSAREWLQDVLDDEIPKIAKLIPKGATKYFLLTNVAGSAHPDAGSIDSLQSLLDTVGIPAFAWWRDDLNRRLDTAWDLKWAYPQLMTGPDLIRAIVEAGLSEDKERRTSAITAFLTDQFARDSEVKFKQVELQNRLTDLFIDVPAIAPREYGSSAQAQRYQTAILEVLRDLAGRGVHSFDDNEAIGYYGEGGFVRWHGRYQSQKVGSASLLLHATGQKLISRLVLEGAPGQGKSTIAQYVCQVFRMHLLNKSDDLERIPAHHRNIPLRLPFKVDLRDLASWLARKNPFDLTEVATTPPYYHKSLEGFLAAQIRFHSGGANFSVADLQAVAKISPILLVFDGLDEVADISRRSDVVDEIDAGVRRIESLTPSLQVIITSRPAAFANSPGLRAEDFPYFQLAPVTRPLIDEYAEKWLAARNLGPTEGKEVRRILKEKLDQPHLRDLARNPMQLAILLSLIHTRGSSLPDKRTALYDNYVELFFSREAEKSVVVRTHRDLLINIHRYLAWILHTEAETSGTEGISSGSISTQRLESVLREYLISGGHDPGLVGDLFSGMVERVVALVSRVEGTFEFEVQPLREYFAARFLYETAPYSPPGNEKRGTKPDRFDAIAHNFYWLNVTRFYSGCYSIGELPSLIDRLAELIRKKGYKYISHPRILSSMLLADWVFAQHPRSVKEVVDMILDGVGLRFVLASSVRGHLGSVPLILPADCGRAELLQRCFALLKSDPVWEYAVDVIELINQNAGTAEIKPLWREEVLNRSGADRSRWLEYGLLLGFLIHATESELSTLIGDAPSSPARLSLLLRARRTDVIEANETVKATVEAILDRDIEVHPTESRASILEAFGMVLNPEVYSTMFEWNQPSTVAQRIRALGVSIDSGEYEKKGNRINEDLKTCLSVVETALGAFESPPKEWVTTLNPWDAVIEPIRAVWGDRWALCNMANLAAGITSQAERGKDAVDPSNETHPLCHRARYARLRAGNTSWWRKRLTSSSNESAMAFELLLFLTWGSPKSLLELTSIVNDVVSALPSEWWTRIANSLEQLTPPNFLVNAPKSADLVVADGLTQISERCALALAFRGTSETRRRLFWEHFGNYVGDDRAVLRFSQAVAFDLLLREPGDRSNQFRLLKVVERNYSKGVATVRQIRQRYSQGFAGPPLADDAYTRIIDRADRYPGMLVGIAESRIRQVVAANIVPVARVATTQGWFTDSDGKGTSVGPRVQKS